MNVRTLAKWLCAVALAFPSFLPAQEIVQSRGVDARVDYQSLLHYGPWDDRNYQLNAEDLALLPDRDLELTEAVPAFYRVEIARRHPDLSALRHGRYPRSTLPRFLLRYGGYLVDGKVYRRVRHEGSRFQLVLDDGIDAQKLVQPRAFDGEARVTNPTGAAESAIAINPVQPNFVIAGSNGPGSGQEMHYSTDGGATWQSAAPLPLGGTCCDPTVAWSSDGNLAYTATLGNNVYFYRSSDNGQTWADLQNEPGNDPRREIDSGFVDKEYIHVDTHAASPHRDNIYMTWHLNNVMSLSHSTDRGHTWSPVRRFSAADEGIGSDITTDKNGHVYYIYPAPSPSQRIRLLKSTDGGASFAPQTTVATTQGDYEFPLPSMETRRVFIYVSADADLSNGPYGNSIYAAWTDSTGPTSGAASNHGRIQVGYSRDGGATWATSTPHETADANTVDRYHSWLKVGPDGNVHVVFYDTRRDLPGRTQVDLFHSVSTDGAQSWSTPTRLTSQQSPNIGDGFEFGDYNGLDVVMNDLIAIFTDNRNEGGGGGDSVDVYAAGRELQGTDDEIFTDGFESADTSAWGRTQQ